MVRFLHTADWQLGMTRHFLSEESQARFSGARLDAISRIGELAAAEGCGFVLVCGDVFESSQVDRRVLARAVEKMRAAPWVHFYLLPGNHDPLDASSVFRSSAFAGLKPENVTVLQTREPVMAAPGVELLPAPWPNKRPLTDLVNDACEGSERAGGRTGRIRTTNDTGKDSNRNAGSSTASERVFQTTNGTGGGSSPADAIRIVVGHGAVDVLSPNPGDPAAIALARLEERIESGLVHYAALGDRHSTTSVGGSGRVWYSGAPEPTDYVEDDPGNVLVVDLAADGVRVDRRRVGTWSFIRRAWELTGGEDIDVLREWLHGLSDKERTIVKLVLTGQVSVAQKARLDSLLGHCADLFAAVEVWEGHSDLVVIPDHADLHDFGFSGFASAALSDLRDLARSGDRAVTARDALALLHRLAAADR